MPIIVRRVCGNKQRVLVSDLSGRSNILSKVEEFGLDIDSKSPQVTKVLDKIKILEMLWGLVYADGHMDKYEESLMRKITPLIGLGHGEMIQAKLKAKK